MFIAWHLAHQVKLFLATVSVFVFFSTTMTLLSCVCGNPLVTMMGSHVSCERPWHAAAVLYNRDVNISTDQPPL